MRPFSAARSQDRERAQRHRFQAKTGQVCWLSEGTGNLRVAVGWDGACAIAALGGLPLTLGQGACRLAEPVDEVQLLGWGLGCYQFTRYLGLGGVQHEAFLAAEVRGGRTTTGTAIGTCRRRSRG